MHPKHDVPNIAGHPLHASLPPRRMHLTKIKGLPCSSTPQLVRLATSSECESLICAESGRQDTNSLNGSRASRAAVAVNGSCAKTALRLPPSGVWHGSCTSSSESRKAQAALSVSQRNQREGVHASSLDHFQSRCREVEEKSLWDCKDAH